MVSLIDADIIPYSACYAGMKTGMEVDELKNKVDKWMKTIITGCQSRKYIAFLTGENNYRCRIFPEYKANRTGNKPVYHKEIREHMKVRWKSCEVHGIEADDALAICQTKLSNTTICSTDKDLKQVTGNHYNIRDHKTSYVTEREAYSNLWSQVITGDTVDNIPGITGYGPVKARKYLETSLLRSYPDAVRSLYNDDENFILNYRLIWLLRDNVNFKIPKIQII